MSVKPRPSGLRPEAGLIVILIFLFETAILSPVGYFHSKLIFVEFEFSAGEVSRGWRGFLLLSVFLRFIVSSILLHPWFSQRSWPADNV